MSFDDMGVIAPLLMVTLAACACLVAESFRHKGERWPFGILAFIGLAGAIFSSVQQWGQDLIGFGVILADSYALFFNIVACGIGLLMLLLSAGTSERDHIPQGEY